MISAVPALVQFTLYVLRYLTCCNRPPVRGGLPISYHLRHFTLYFIYDTNLNANDYWIL